MVAVRGERVSWSCGAMASCMRGTSRSKKLKIPKSSTACVVAMLSRYRCASPTHELESTKLSDAPEGPSGLTERFRRGSVPS